MTRTDDADPAAADARQRAIELLEANHVFPGPFSLSVIAFNDDVVTAAIVEAASVGLSVPLAADAHQRLPSAQGKYVSHRLTVPAQSAPHVLDLFARLRLVKGVVSVL